MNKHKLSLNNPHQRFSIRKLSIGTVSVLLGIAFLSNAQNAHADTTNQIDKQEQVSNTINTPISTKESVHKNDANSNNVDSKLLNGKTQELISNNGVSLSKETKIQNKKQNSTIATTKDSVEKDTSTSQIKQNQPSRVSVHDPSIFQDPKTGKYYVFGSHQAEAESDDLYNWKPLFKKEYEQPSYVFNDYDKDLTPIFKWAGSHDGDVKNGYAIWAPDEIYNPDYKWQNGDKGAYMYYFSTSSSWIHSAIGFAISKTVHGPYKFVNTLIYSGFTKDRLHNGDSSNKDDRYNNTNLKSLIKSGKIDGFSNKWIRADGTYNNDYAPNAIDVNIVTDKNNKLWMSYGSWSGGIFLLPLNKETGMPIYPGKDSVNKYDQKVDRYFGTHLIGGFHESGEAPYIKYDKNTGYYYLFTTYGGLTRNGGYNMRLFRSKEIDGKYVDQLGQHPEYTSWKTNDSTLQENQKYGIKLEGNYDFSCLPYSYMSPGHNSAFIDKNGNWYLINHTRFNNNTEMHQIRVKQMIMTDTGWPIPLPFEYSGKEQKISQANLSTVENQLTGIYEFVNNNTRTQASPIAPASIQLTKDHKILGSIKGTWSSEYKNNKLLLHIIDNNGSEYTGEFRLQQDESDSHKPVLVFAALGNNEVIWGEKEFINKNTDNSTTHKSEPVNNESSTNNKDINEDIISVPSSNIDQNSNNPINTNNNKDVTNSTANNIQNIAPIKADTLMHAAFLYDKNGNRLFKSKTLTTYSNTQVIAKPISINHKKYYKLADKEAYILAGNIDGTLRKLHHNAYIYNSKGKRIKKLGILKKGTKKYTYGGKIKIKNKYYYRIAKGRYVKATNFF